MLSYQTHDQEVGKGCFSLAPNDCQQSQTRKQLVVELDHGLLQSSNLTWLFQLAWGMVLRLYTGSDELAFLYIRDGVNGRKLSICDIDLSNATPKPEIRQKSLNDFNKLKMLSGNLNTALCIRNPQSSMNSFQTFKDAEGIDLFMDVQATANSFNHVLDYNQYVLSDDRAKSVTEAFKLAFSSLAQHPSSTPNEINLCNTQDVNQLIRWHPAMPYQQPICVHDAILQHCIAHPTGIAVDSWDGSLTYGELDKLSARLAHHLHELGVNTETLVPLCFEKSRWAIVAVLSVIRAGGAYSFIDPSYPVARMTSICEDLQAKYLICSDNHSAMGNTLCLHTVVVSEETLSKLNDVQNQTINTNIAPSNAVYTAFSSGSTGKPKGVTIEHGSFYLRAQANKVPLSLNNQSRTMQFANYVFDVSNRDILYTLIFGGCICIPSDFDRFHNLMAFMNEKKINWASLTPSLASLLDPNSLPHLQQLVLCGEPMAPDYLTAWGDKVNLINAYGPCETVTVSAIRTNMGPHVHHSNIGHGYGSNIWIVDMLNHNKLLPIGAVGELLIESPSVGRGYINNPAETKAAFVSSPAWLSSVRGSCDRVYKTGDIGRYETDGSIRFMGRKDSQVKIRGQRVELSEIEHHIQQSLGQGMSIPVVVDLIKPQALKSALLIAFLAIKQHAKDVVSDKEAALRNQLPGLEKRLSKLLPAYMLPSEFIILDKIPMTATGKCNRRELCEMYAKLTLDELHKQRLSKSNTTTPACEIEQRLQHIWASVLDIEVNTISTDKSFFSLRGDSISAMRVAALCRSERLDLSVADILEHKHLNELADVLSNRAEIKTNVQFTPFSLVDSRALADLPVELGRLRSENKIEDIVPATATQLFFLYQWSLSSFRCILEGEIDVDRLRAACQTVVSQHSSLRTVYSKLSDTTFQITLKDIDVPFSHVNTDERFDIVCQSTTDDDLEEPPTSGNPLVKFTLISRSETEHALMVRVSHAQYDGYSSPVLFKSISSLYKNPRTATTHPTPYSHYVHACHQHKTREAFDFWRNNLQGSTMTKLPLLPSYCKDKQQVDIRQGASGKIPIPPQEFTVPTLVNAALSITLSQLFKQDDVVFGVVMNTRDIALPGVEAMLGSCININPFRTHLPDSQTALELCKSLHHQYVQVSRYSYLDLQDILANSTNWNPTTQLGFMVNHLDGNKQSAPLALDGAPCTSFGWKANINISDQVLVRSVTTMEDLQIQVLTSDRVMSVEDASALARRLVDTAQMLAKEPSMLLSSPEFKQSS